MVTVDLAVAIFALDVLAAFSALLVWAIRHQDRMFPKGFRPHGLESRLGA